MTSDVNQIRIIEKLLIDTLTNYTRLWVKLSGLTSFTVNAPTTPH